MQPKYHLVHTGVWYGGCFFSKQGYMATYSVNLIGERIAPNLRFIKEFYEEVDHYIFLSTPEMQHKNKLKSYTKAYQLPPEKVSTLVAHPYDIEELQATWAQLNIKAEDTYLVNITGGTRPMALVCLHFFEQFDNARVYFIPAGKGYYQEMHPNFSSANIEFKRQLTLKEYVTGFNQEVVEMQNRPSRPIHTALELMEQYTAAHGKVKRIPELKRAQKHASPEDRQYYSGGWFEEYVFWKIKEHFKLNDEQIAYQVKLRNKKALNEYDVVFLLHDTFFILECKAYFGKINLAAKIQKALYKLGALDDEFGIKAKSVFFTTYDIQGRHRRDNQLLHDRSKALHVRLLQYHDLLDDSFLRKLV